LILNNLTWNMKVFLKSQIFKRDGVTKHNISWIISAMIPCHFLVSCPRNIFNKLSFRVKREILVYLDGCKISPFGRDDNLIVRHDTKDFESSIMHLLWNVSFFILS
jgi:hypothetical protein